MKRAIQEFGPRLEKAGPGAVGLFYYAGHGVQLSGHYKGLSGNVWQWVDSKVGGRKVLKGGSWLEPNPANKRAATRRYELSSRADEDSGFRCAKAASAWPDAELWLAQLK
jgi:hypothetical protein